MTKQYNVIETFTFIPYSKNQLVMIKSIKLLFAVTIFSFLFMACGKDKKDKKDNITVFKATLSGSQEIPSNASMATGNATLTYNGDTKTFTSTTTYTGLTPTMGHIHKAAMGTNGPVIFPFTSLTSPIEFTSPVLTDAQVTALFKDSMYVNLHTTLQPGGEIRGQLIKQ